jgi:hypothetical protein
MFRFLSGKKSTSSGDKKPIVASETLPLTISPKDLKKINPNLYKQIEKSLAQEPHEDPLFDLYMDVKRANQIKFYFNNKAMPSDCTFILFKKFLSETLGEEATETLRQNYHQGIITTLSSDILNFGFSENKLLSQSSDKEYSISFSASSLSDKVRVINRVSNCKYKEVDSDAPEKKILQGTFDVLFKLTPGATEVVSLSTNSFRMFALLFMKDFKKQIPFLDHCGKMVYQCDTQISQNENSLLSLAYLYLKDRIIQMALKYIKNPEKPHKMDTYTQILKSLENSSYQEQYILFQEALSEIKSGILIQCKKYLDEHKPEDKTSNHYEAYDASIEIIHKIEENMNQLKNSFPPNFEEHLEKLQQINKQLILTYGGLQETFTNNLENRRPSR